MGDLKIVRQQPEPVRELPITSVEVGHPEYLGHVKFCRNASSPPGLLIQPKGQPSYQTILDHDEALEFAHAIITMLGQDIRGGDA